MRQICPFISAGLRRYLRVTGANLPRSLASRARFGAICCRNRTMLRAWRHSPDYACVWGFMPMGVLNQWLTQRGKPAAAIAYLCAGVHFGRQADAIFCRLFVGSYTGRLKGDTIQAYFAHLKCVRRFRRGCLMNWPLRQRVIMRSYRGVRSTNNRTCPETLKGAGAIYEYLLGNPRIEPTTDLECIRGLILPCCLIPP